MNEICPNCGKPTSEHLMIFYPDGRVEETCRKYVSVPVEFVEKTRNLFDTCESLLCGPEWKEYGRLAVGDDWSDGDKQIMLNAMLDMNDVLTEIEKGGGV